MKEFKVNLEKIELEETHAPEEIEEIIGDQNGETKFLNYENKRFKISRQPPRSWKCTRCGNTYTSLHHHCECHNKKFKLFYKDYIDLKDFYYFNSEFFAMDIDSFLIQKMKKFTTELITDIIKDNNHIYTTRDDKNSEVWIYKEGIYVSQGKTYIKEYCRKVLQKNYTIQMANEIISKIETDTYISQEAFFSNNIVEEIALENGLLNLKTRELNNFNPKKIFFTKIPIKYDPLAVCPNIETHFKTVLKNSDDAKVMFELFGYLLWKEYKIEKAVMFVGDGRNGKSKTLELMKLFIGIDNCSSVPLHQLETDIYSPSELFNKLANLAGDLDSKALKDTGTLKTLTGRDLIAAPRKFLTRLNFVNFAKMVFACNKLPRTYDTSTAFWNRWVLFEFPYTFLSEEEINVLPIDKRTNIKLRDINIVEKLTSPEELSGLLNKALDGLKIILKNNDFSNSVGVDEIKNMWIRKSDSFLAYCLDNVEESDDTRIEKKILRKAYGRYCKDHKIKMLSDKLMRETLFEQYAVSEERDETGRYWEGICFKEGKIVEDLSGKKSLMS